MAKVIKFYVPNRFHKKVAWALLQRRGKLIEFRVQLKNLRSLVGTLRQGKMPFSDSVSMISCSNN